MGSLLFDDITNLVANLSTKISEINDRSYSGKGIVTASGGKFLSQSYVSISILRKNGCSLPIEMFYADKDEIDDVTKQRFCKLYDNNITFINIQDCPMFSNYDAHNFSIKSIAVYLSKFSEIIWMDADIIPLMNFEKLFVDNDNSHYKRLGHYFNNDIFSYKKYHNEFTEKTSNLFSKFKYKMCEGEPETDSGLFMLHKNYLHKDIVKYFLLLNVNRHIVYNHVYGDKELFKLSFHLTNTPYTTLDAFPHLIGKHFEKDEIFCGNAVLLPNCNNDDYVAVHMTLHSIDHRDLFERHGLGHLWTHYVNRSVDTKIEVVNPLNQELVPRFKYDYKFIKRLDEKLSAVQKDMYAFYDTWNKKEITKLIL